MISAVLFFPGCNLRCPWCHNRELVFSGAGPGNGDLVPLEEAFAHLEKRQKILGGAVLSGGEPALVPGLGKLIRRIKTMGLKVKLDTNGTRPDVLEALFSRSLTRPDYIAMDLKLAPHRYGELLPPPSGEGQTTFDPGGAVRQSAALIRSSGIPHEFRSLLLPEAYFSQNDRAALAPLAGDSPWYFRPFVPGNCLDPAWNEKVGL